ncbi:hypothetical protein [Sphingobacterium endophyticum]|uniref:hypothetical protein n=1 Tax=Sphingobacterium endophyticum TaxID=2546448 RepID=UPI0012E1D963|nr:hypothetical protein [Sphingobacterium endophyticum]
MKRLPNPATQHLIAIILSGIFAYFLTSCKKDQNSKEDPLPEPIEADVYVTGIKKVDGVNRPFFHKNGNEYMLAYDGNVSATASDIFVSQGNVYVVGFINSDLTWQYHPKTAVLWKNGKLQKLETPTSAIRSEAKAVFVSNSDVYVAGRYIKTGGKWVACVWKNGKATDLTDGRHTARLYDIHVVGNDTYVAGYEINEEIGTQGKYWKNGIPTVLENRNDENLVPNQITVLGSDIYVVGSGFVGDSQTVQYWKNGKQHILPTKTSPVNYGQSITTDHNNVLIGGTVDNQPMVWKNARSLDWNINPDPSINAELSDLKVLKGNAFATGWRKNEKNRPLWIWKNGQEYFSSEGDTHYTPTGLFVEERKP